MSKKMVVVIAFLFILAIGIGVAIQPYLFYSPSVGYQVIEGTPT